MVLLNLAINSVVVYLIGYFILALVHANDTSLVYCEKTRHFVVPVLAVLMPAFVIGFVAKMFGRQLAIRGNEGSVLRLVQFVNEHTVYLWSTYVNTANAVLVGDLIAGAKHAPTVRMLFERSKMCIALQEKKRYILKAFDERKKTHFLMDYYGYERLLGFLSDEHRTQELRSDFDPWRGDERRKAKCDSESLRLGDKKYICSLVDEGMAMR